MLLAITKVRSLHVGLAIFMCLLKFISLGFWLIVASFIPHILLLYYFKFLCNFSNARRAHIGNNYLVNNRSGICQTVSLNICLLKYLRIIKQYDVNKTFAFLWDFVSIHMCDVYHWLLLLTLIVFTSDFLSFLFPYTFHNLSYTIVQSIH